MLIPKLFFLVVTQFDDYIQLDINKKAQDLTKNIAFL